MPGPNGVLARSARKPIVFVKIIIIIIIIIFLPGDCFFDDLSHSQNSPKLEIASEVAKIAIFCIDWAQVHQWAR